MLIAKKLSILPVFWKYGKNDCKNSEKIRIFAVAYSKTNNS